MVNCSKYAPVPTRILKLCNKEIPSHDSFQISITSYFSRLPLLCLAKLFLILGTLVLNALHFFLIFDSSCTGESFGEKKQCIKHKKF